MRKYLHHWTTPILIPCKGMKKPAEIIHVFRNLKIEKYPYAISHSSITVKFGASAPATKDTEPGERVYRQIGQLHSWGYTKITGPNGSDFRDIDKKYQDMYSEPMNHNNILITVWPMDNYPFITTDPWKEVNWGEQELIENYEKFYGSRPIGNVDNGSLMNNKSAPLKGVVEHIFN